MKKKAISLLLAVTLCAVSLSACGTKTNNPDPVPSGTVETENSQESSEEQPSSETSPSVEAGSEDGEGSQDYAPELSPSLGYKEVIQNISYSDFERENFGCVQVKRTSFVLDDASAKMYPALAKSLDDINSSLKSDVEDTMKMLKEGYETDIEYDNYFTPYEDVVDAKVARNDDLVFSWTENFSSYSGGAHGYYATSGIAFDPETGKKLLLSDVITDVDSFRKQIAEKLDAEYGDIFFSDIHETMKEYNLEDFNWSIDYSGITFYFNPYELASYADGMQSVTFFFAESPDILNQKYITTPSKYVIDMAEYANYYVDIDGDGDKETVSYVSDYVDEYSYKPYFMVDGEKITIDDTDFSSEAYLIDNMGKYYIYLFHSVENDYSILQIVDLQNKKVIGKDYEYGNYYLSGGTWDYDDSDDSIYSYRSEVPAFTNPDKFEMGTRLDLLSTYSGTKTYHVDENGIPVSDDVFYTTSAPYLLLTLKDVPCSIVDQEGNTVEESATLAPGRYMKIIRATGNSVDLVVASDYVPNNDDEYYGYYIGDQKLTYDMSTIYRITFSEDNHYEIAGSYLDEWFEGLMFAG